MSWDFEYAADQYGRAFPRFELPGVGGKARALLGCAAAQGTSWCVQGAARASLLSPGEAGEIAADLARQHPDVIELDVQASTGELAVYRFTDPAMADRLLDADAEEVARHRAIAAAGIEEALRPGAAIPRWAVNLVGDLWMGAEQPVRAAAWRLRRALEADNGFERVVQLLKCAEHLLHAAEHADSPRLLRAEMPAPTTPPVPELVAAAAAGLAADPSLRAELLLLQAGFHAREHGSDLAALGILRDAVQAAKLGSARYVELIALAEYGRAVAKHDLPQALATLSAAVELADDPANTPDARTLRAAWTARLQFAVAAYDAGSPGVSLTMLTELCERPVPEGFGVITAMAWHYRAQILESIGRPGPARRALDTCRSSCEAERIDPEAAGWSAYCDAQAARLDARYLNVREDGGEQAAAAIAERARTAREQARAAASACPTLPPITDLLCADALTDLAAIDPAYAHAAREIAELAGERAHAGPARPRIAALASLARAELALDQVPAAFEHASLAVTLLDEHGGVLSALRTEELLLTAAQAALAFTDRVGAAGFIDRARRVVEGKRLQVPDPDRSLDPFAREPVNASIARLHAQLGAQPPGA